MAAKRLWISLSLHSSDKAVTPPDVFKVSFYEFSDCFKSFYHIYTDGFRMGHCVSAALCKKRCTSDIRLLRATSIFNAELHAILFALNVVRRSKENTISCWQTHNQVWLRLEGHVDKDTTFKYLNTYSTLTNSGKTIILCWILVYVGIPGNERADWVANATLSFPTSQAKVSAMDFFPRAKLLMHKEWQEIWNAVMVTSFMLAQFLKRILGLLSGPSEVVGFSF